MEEMRGRARSGMKALDEAVKDTQYPIGDAFAAADLMMGYRL